MFLSDKELESLTGYRRGKEQCAWLSDHGWVFEKNSHGKPRVAVEYFKYRMGVSREAPKRLQLNFA